MLSFFGNQMKYATRGIAHGYVLTASCIVLLGHTALFASAEPGAGALLQVDPENLGSWTTGEITFAVPAFSHSVPCRYACLSTTPDGKSRVIVNGKAGPEFDRIGRRATVGGFGVMLGPIFSKPARHLAYAAMVEGRWCVVVDGERGPMFEDVGNPIFSVGGEHCAYAAEVDSKWHVVLDGLRGPAFDKILEGTIVFSPDGSRLAYAARSENRTFVVVDNQRGKGYEGILTHGVAKPPIRFSPDGRHLAYVAQKEDQFAVVVDGEEGPPYPKVLLDSVLLSRSGKHCAYVACKGGDFFGGKRVLVLDGKEIAHVSGAFCARFS
ncbi:MAG: hypothetical protein WBC59_01285, partial [Phycisphaerae bacterium]